MAGMRWHHASRPEDRLRVAVGDTADGAFMLHGRGTWDASVGSDAMYGGRVIV